MSSRTFILIRNTILTAVYAWLTWGFQQKGNNEAVAMGLTAIASLWVHSGRDKSRTSGGLSVLVPMTCALTLLSACEFQGGTVRLGPASPVIIQPGPVERLRAEYRAQAGLLADSIEFTAAAAPTFTSGRGGIYLLNTDGLFHTVDVAGLDLKLHAAQSYRTSASCAGLSGPTNGDVCFDTSLGTFRGYSGGWQTLFSLSGTKLPIAQGGTNSSTALSNGRVMVSSAGAIVELGSAGTSSQVLHGSSTQTWGAVALASEVSGTLPTTNGGTGLASFTANRVLYTSSTSAIGQLGCSDGQVITWSSGVPVCSTPTSIIGTIYGGQTNTDAFGASTVYLGALGTSSFVGSQVSVGTITRTGTIRYLTVSIRTAPGGADTVIATAQKSSNQGSTWSDTTLTCTITGAAKTCTDTSNTPAVALYDWIAIKLVSSAGTAAGPTTAGMEVN